MKPIRHTKHASQQARERGASKAEIQQAIIEGQREATKKGRYLCRYNFPYGDYWSGKYYNIKQVVPVIKEELEEIVVVTVYTFYF